MFCCHEDLRDENLSGVGGIHSYDRNSKRPKSISRRNAEEKLNCRQKKCPRKDIISSLESNDSPGCIKRIINQVRRGELTSTAGMIFCLKPYVSDRGKLFSDTLEKELAYFRQLVNDVVDRRVQDESDVINRTKKSIEETFSRLTDSMNERTKRIRERLLRISRKFDWKNDGKDSEKLLRMIVIKKREMPSESRSTENLIHRISIRGQWLKRELCRLQDENNNLKKFLEKTTCLAFERKAHEIEVPRLLSQEKRNLEKQLDKLKITFNRNVESIDNLLIEKRLIH